MSDPDGRPTILISADHGLAIVYFLQSDVVSTLIESGYRVVLLTDDALIDQIRGRFGRDGLQVDGLRLDRARAYADTVDRERQWWVAFLRRVGASRRINTEAMDSYVEQVAVEEPNRRRIWMPLAWALLSGLRASRRLRRRLVEAQRRFNPRLYADLLARHHPSLVVGSTPGWRLDRYLLREAAANGIPTASVVVGWDNPSSYSLPGADVDRMTCWSAIQKEELVLGSDWSAERVDIGGIPSYDGYFRNRWTLPRREYFDLHRLDPKRKLIAYACSFVSFAPNLPNVETLTRLVVEGRLNAPSQLLIRLHPNHFMDVHLFQQERERIRELARRHEHVHVVDPVPLGGELGHYSGEDMPEKASMMAHADVFVTVYSTMVVEAAIHDRPVVSLVLDAKRGWDTPRKYSLPLSRIGGWPTHRRFREARAGRVAFSLDEGLAAINAYLADPGLERRERRAFVEREVTFTDGSAGRRTAEILLGWADGHPRTPARQSETLGPPKVLSRAVG